jgi:hypothetical protein
MLFNVGSENQNISRMAASVIGDLVRSNSTLDINPREAVERRAFLEANGDLNPVADFLRKLAKADEVAVELIKEPFEVDRANFYRATIDAGTSAVSYLNFLDQGIVALDANEWVRSLNAESGPHFDLLDLARDVRNRKKISNFPSTLMTQRWSK